MMIWRLCSLALASSALHMPGQASCPPPIHPSELEVYPSADTLPENLIRFYIYFPRSMARDIGTSDIQLVDSNGEIVQQAFLPMRYELWSSDRTRLTLILDPGRVKSGLAAHDALGRALRAGEAYTLKIPGTLKDANGCGLEQNGAMSFVAGPLDRDPPDPKVWRINAPSAGSRAPLSVDLQSPHDHLSMAYRIRVVREDGEVVAGQVGLEAQEQVWTFLPHEPWADTPYRIEIDERLEDLSGNRPGIPFDRAAHEAPQAWTQAIPFVPKH